MEKIVEKRMKIKFIEVQSDEFEELVYYKAFDGKVFQREDEAIRYEGNLKIKTIEQKEFDGFSKIYGNWYRAKNEDELNFLKNWLADRNPRSAFVYGDEKIRVGEWFTVSIDYGGDSKDNYNFITLKDIKKEIEDFLDIFE